MTPTCCVYQLQVCTINTCIVCNVLCVGECTSQHAGTTVPHDHAWWHQTNVRTTARTGQGRGKVSTSLSCTSLVLGTFSCSSNVIILVRSFIKHRLKIVLKEKGKPLNLFLNYLIEWNKCCGMLLIRNNLIKDLFFTFDLGVAVLNICWTEDISSFNFFLCPALSPAPTPPHFSFPPSPFPQPKALERSVKCNYLIRVCNLLSRKSWAGHIGFEPHRCYGDVTLRFQFTPSNISQDQRPMFVRDLDPADQVDLAGVGIEVEANDSSQEELSDSEAVWVIFSSLSSVWKH